MIHQTDSTFSFDKLALHAPASVGGNYFIKYSIDGSALYIQPPKCLVKQISVSSKNAKKMHCDLQFGKDCEEFIQWMEHLETHTQKLLYDNREKWFESDLELQDIENSFTSPMKIYKSGKYYLVRSNLQNQPGIIYDENENPITTDGLQENTEVMVILELQGVKCSARNFQIEIDMKQIMVFKPKNLFEKCILNPRRESASQKDVESTSVSGNLVEDSTKKSIELFNGVNPNHLGNSVPPRPIENVPPVRQVPIKLSLRDETVVSEEEEKKDSADLCEVDFNLEEIPQESVRIKQRSDVYYEMYREARKKAKIARDLALSAYLEAKHIKNTYLLDDLNDSDSDFEEEEEEEEDDDGDGEVNEEKGGEK